VVSRGQPAPAAQETVRVPGVLGLRSSDAVRAIRDAGLEIRVRLVTSSQPAGTVVDQSPAEDTDASKGDEVRIDVAKARPAAVSVEVPDVVGSTAATARRDLRSAGLTVTVVSIQSQQPDGSVVSQSPRAGAEVRKGAEVTLRVSSGPAEVDVPDVTGLDEASARTELENAGFQVEVTEESTTDPTEDGVVVRQSPTGGSTTAKGAVITLTVARLD
jgi:beta-lactam-binding protein with PASTA domain